MQTLRTPEERFRNLPDFPYVPKYVEIPDAAGGMLRMAYIDEGPADAPPVLLLHGEPSWSFLYRSLIPILTRAGLRAVAPDLVGFGRSDKPAAREDYSYNRQVDWLTAWLQQNDVREATLVCQDWGGLIGLRMLAENPDLSLELIRELVRRVRETNEQIRGLLFERVEGRTRRLLRRLARDPVPDHPDRLGTSPITHQQLADLVGTSRETVTRVIKELKDEGWLDQEGKSYQIPKEDP